MKVMKVMKFHKPMKYIKPPKHVPYVPPKQQVDDKKARPTKRDQHWITILPKLAKMTERHKIGHLRKVKWLPTRSTCPRCNEGKLSKLRNYVGRVWCRRCGNKACNRIIQPHSIYPVFNCADGKNKIPLNDQTQVAFSRVVGVRFGVIHTLFGASRKL